MRTYFITGGCGFIGSNFIQYLFENQLAYKVVNLDKLTYAGNKENLSSIEHRDNYHFIKGDICDGKAVRNTLEKYKPDVVVNFAAESHVDRSIDAPTEFIQTNVVGTLNLLNESNKWLKKLEDAKKSSFRFIHISTDEVYGSLEKTGKFLETTPYDPSSPYSASKAGSDHLVRSWFRTFDFPAIITNCSNNYGPYQFPEKLIPVLINKAINNEPLPIYGDGRNIRDWIHVDDHADAIWKVLIDGSSGLIYNIGGNNQRRNLDISKIVLDYLGDKTSSKIEFVRDRPGHDWRYAVDDSLIRDKLEWEPKVSFESGIESTIEWYIKNEDWWRPLLK